MNDEKHSITEAIEAARRVQEFLWGDKNRKWGFEEWKRMLRKRVAKLEEIDKQNPHAVVEVRKRLLQTAALSIALLNRIELEGIPWEAKENIPSNLPEYYKKIYDE